MLQESIYESSTPMACITDQAPGATRQLLAVLKLIHLLWADIDVIAITSSCVGGADGVASGRRTGRQRQIGIDGFHLPFQGLRA